MLISILVNYFLNLLFSDTYRIFRIYSEYFINIFYYTIYHKQTAIISPILKQKQNIDPNSHSNYRPISYLPLLNNIFRKN